MNPTNPVNLINPCLPCLTHEMPFCTPPYPRVVAPMVWSPDVMVARPFRVMFKIAARVSIPERCSGAMCLDSISSIRPLPPGTAFGDTYRLTLPLLARMTPTRKEDRLNTTTPWPQRL